MTGAQYAAIAAACDRLLRAPATTLARLAIPALHCLNEHPSSLAQYAPVLAGRRVGSLSELPLAGIRAARALARAQWRQAPPPQGPVDVVIVSHLLRPEQLLQEDDFYFGALQSQLQALGATTLVVLINHLHDVPRKPQLHGHPSRRLVLPSVMSPATEGSLWRQCCQSRRDLRREAAAAGNSIEGAIARLASHQAVSAATAVNLRMQAALADLFGAVTPHMVITTYEGTVAERLIWNAARASGQRPLCVGYQHATVLERAHAIRRPVAAARLDCDPDLILTLGAITQAALAGSAALRSVPFIQYGSHRRAILPTLPAPHARAHCCLVLPDASHQECVTLFDFALRCARLNADMRFILRPHPLVDSAALRRRLPALDALPDNVSLSIDRALEQDLAQARYCLYRGSSAAVQAVRAGIRPFYLAQPGELPIDCLFVLDDWRGRVSSPEDFMAQIRRADSVADPTAATQAAALCDRYVAPSRPEAVPELLAVMRSRHGS